MVAAKRGRPKKNGGSNSANGQQYLGDTDPRIPECEEAGQTLLASREQLANARDNVREASEAMLEAMHEAGIDTYKCSGRIFSVEAESEKVIVKKVKLSETANA